MQARQHANIEQDQQGSKSAYSGLSQDVKHFATQITKHVAQ